MVSIIIATYRRDSALEAAIKSVLKQSYRDIEVVVVDDNANIGWNRKVQDIVSKFPQVKYVQNKKNKGSAETRNIGIKVANGAFITFLDDDDIYLPEKIEYQVTQMILNNADYSVTDLYLYSEDGKLIDKRIRKYIRATDSQSLFEYHLMYHITGTDTMMFRKEYLLKIGGFPLINIGDEFYLMKEAIVGHGKFLYVPGCYIKAYVHTGENGLSSGLSKIDGENALYEYKKTFFKEISPKNRKYIKMRHYAVLSFAYLRMKKYIQFGMNSIRAITYSPTAAIALLKERLNS